ncbi:MAG: carboxypeptidase regulatory-like domain-containing protein [Planctomycetes bacterium]|nr:carboxypeptidase regulatory-like domain-containing protein [Planctomycetota bacterium]
MLALLLVFNKAYLQQRAATSETISLTKPEISTNAKWKEPQRKTFLGQQPTENELNPLTSLLPTYLTIEIDSASDFDLSNLLIKLTSEKTLLPTTNLIIFPSLKPAVTSQRNASQSTLCFHLHSESSKISFSGLNKDVPFTAQLISPTGSVLAESRVVTLAGSQRETIYLYTESPIQGLTGVVQNIYGEPIPKAEILLTVPPAGITFALTNQNGEFSFGGLDAKKVNISISADGYASSYIVDLDIAKHLPAKPFILRELRNVKLNVVDSNREVVADCGLYYGWNNGGIFASNNNDGTYSLNGVPKNEFVLNWYSGGAAGAVTVNGGIEQVELMLPKLHSIELDVTRKTSRHYQSFVVEILSSEELSNTFQLAESQDPDRQFSMGVDEEHKEVGYKFAHMGMYYIRVLEWSPQGESLAKEIYTAGPFSFDESNTRTTVDIGLF